MSPIVRAGLLFGIASVAAFVASFFLPLPLVNILLAYGSILALGWGAGYTAAKTSGAFQGQGTGRGAAAGALAGAVNLVLVMIALTLLLSVVARLPAFQNAFQSAVNRAQAQNPNANLRNIPAMGTLAGIGGAAVGFCLGLVNVILMTVAGLVGGAMWRGVPTTVMAGGPYDGPAGYTVGSQPPYGSRPPSPGAMAPESSLPPDDTGARIYPEDERR